MTERAGNSDRDMFVTRIQKAYTDGYLDDDEMQDRIDRAFKAKHMVDLHELVRGIPVPPAKKSQVRLPHPIQAYMGMADNTRAGMWGVIAILNALQVVLMGVWETEQHYSSIPMVGAMVMAVSLCVGVPLFFLSLFRILWLVS